MKRKINVLLALLLAFVLVLSACGQKTDKTEDTKEPEKTNGETGKETDKPAEGEDKPAEEGFQIPTGLKGEISVQAETGWKEYYQKVADKIVKANPDAKINLKEIGADDHRKIINDTDGNNTDVADVYAIPADQYTSFVQNENIAALPAKEMAEKLGGWDDFDKGLGGMLKVGEEYLAFPMNIETLVTFVNTKNAEAEGVDITKPLEMVNKEKPATVLLQMHNAWFGVAPNNAGGIELLKQDGDKFMSTYAGKYADLNEEQKAAFDGIYEYWKSHNDAGTALLDKATSGGYVDDEFKTGGKGVARIDGPWATSNGVIADELKAGNVEVFPIGKITVGGKPLTHWQGGWVLVANSRIEEDKDKMALAQAMIMEIVNPANAVDFYKATGKILENVKIDVYEGSDLDDTSKKVIKNVLESYKVSPPRPIFTEYGNVWTTWEDSFISLNSSKPDSAEKAFEALSAGFQAMMNTIGQ